MGARGMQCILVHDIKLTTHALHGRAAHDVAGQVRATPNPCIIADALMQDSAIQFGTGYVLPSSLFFTEKRNQPVAGRGLFLFR